VLKKAHLWIGIIGMALFLSSGQYFLIALNGLQDIEDTPRLLLRTSHVYFFFSCFINILFGLYYVQPPKIRWYTLYNQSLIFFSPIFILYGFVFEAVDNPGIDRYVGSIGVILCFAWLLNICIGKLFKFVKFSKSSKKDALTRASS
jgi:hypothetical protein